MTDQSHAEHRWPVDEDPSQAWQSVPTMMDRFYPLEDVVAVIDDRSTAERAIQALKDAGVADGDVDLADGAWFAQAARSTVQRRGRIARLTHMLETDESLLVTRYVEEADQMHVIIAVHAPNQDHVDRVRAVLAEHGAWEMHHYGKHVILDL